MKKIIFLFCLFSLLLVGCENAHKYFTQAEKDYDQKDYVSAVANFTKAIEIDPKVAIFYYGRGLSKQSLGDLNGAKVDFTNSVPPTMAMGSPAFT